MTSFLMQEVYRVARLPDLLSWRLTAEVRPSVFSIRYAVAAFAQKFEKVPSDYGAQPAQQVFDNAM